MNQCVTLVPPDDTALVPKCCRLLANLVAGQKLLIEGRTLTVTIDWCLQALKQASIDASAVLPALHALLSTAASNISEAVDLVLDANNCNPVVAFARPNKTIDERTLLAVQCLVVCTTATKLVHSQLELASAIFTAILTTDLKTKDDDELLRAKLFGACLTGLQNIAEQSQSYLNAELGVLLGIAKTYMVFALKGVNFIAPQKVLPSILSVPEPSYYAPREKKGGKVVVSHQSSVFFFFFF